jgi:hypothetical protein
LRFLCHEDDHTQTLTTLMTPKSNDTSTSFSCQSKQRTSQPVPATTQHSLEHASAMHTASCVSGPARYPGCITKAFPRRWVFRPPGRNCTARADILGHPNNSEGPTSHATEMELLYSFASRLQKDTRHERTEFKIFETATPTTSQKS